MYLQDLRLYQFRNLEDCSLEFHPQVNLISGKNAQGKSNLIEAIHFLSSTRSFRSARLKELQSWAGEEFSVYGTVRDSIGTSELGITYSGRSRKAYLNGDLVKSAQEYIRYFPVVTFAPRDTDLVFGSPSGRRKFIDRYACLLSPKMFSALANYQKLLRSKGALLKSGRADRGQLETLNEMLAEQAAEVVQGRRTLLDALYPHASLVYGSFTTGDGELSYAWKETFSDQWNAEPNAPAYREVLAEVMNEEIGRRTTVVGPHLDDLNILLGGHEARSFASQGQARSIVLSLLVAVVRVLEQELEKSPVLLLDDFSSELDHERMSKFFELLADRTHQVFITGTELSGDVFAGHEYLHFSVSEGVVESLKST